MNLFGTHVLIDACLPVMLFLEFQPTTKLYQTHSGNQAEGFSSQRRALQGICIANAKANIGQCCIVRSERDVTEGTKDGK